MKPEMMENYDKILIRQVLLGSEPVDILIEGNKIGKISPRLSVDEGSSLLTIEGEGKAVIPGLVNCHTHAAMTLFRGYGDDLDLMDWLENMIWPVEAKMTTEDIYWGSRLACLEMIKSGTTAFLDMYSFPEATAQAVADSGMRATLSYTLFDRGDAERAALDRRNCERYYREFGEVSERIQFAVGPHAIYTVCGEQLQFADRFAEEHNCLVHLHLSETMTEWTECVKLYGTTPVRYLHKLGVLSPRLVLAHALWIDSEEIKMLADHGCQVVHNPASNMKLASGYEFRYEEYHRAGVKVGLGTDGCSSSNNLDMFEAMKLASLLGKAWTGDPKKVSAPQIFRTATEEGASILGLHGGKVEEGRVADLLLVDLKLPEMVPLHNLVSNLVYSANGSCVTDTIVDGRLLMRDRKVEGEGELITKVQKVAEDLLSRADK